MATKTKLRMKDGYCYELSGRQSWRDARNDRWVVEIYKPTGREVLAGFRWIDGSPCVIFKCPDGVHRAQTRVSVMGDALAREVRT